MIDITRGNDWSMRIALTHNEEAFPVTSTENLAVNVVNAFGEKKAFVPTVSEGLIYADVGGYDLPVGTYGIEVAHTGDTNWRTYGAKMVRITNETLKGGSTCSVGGDDYDIIMEANSIVVELSMAVDNYSGGGVSPSEFDALVERVTAAEGDIDALETGKEDVIDDLSEIRSGAALGATALQSFTETDPTVPSWAKASSKPTYTASEVGAVPTTRKVNGKALSSDITLTASDVNALPSSTVIPDAQIQSDWEQTDTDAKDFIKHKPTIPTVPTISTDISSDAASDTKTTSPKAVKTFVENKGYTTNKGTITGITMNGSSKGTSGVVDLGTVITDVSNKQDKIDSSHKLSADLIEDGTTNKVINVKPDWNAASGNAAEILNKPTIPAAPGTLNTNNATAQSVNSSEALSGSIKLHKVSKTGSYNDLLNTPTIPTVPTNVSAFTNDAGYLTSHQDISNYVQKSNTAGLLKNDGTVDTSTYLPSSTAHQVPAGGNAGQVLKKTTGTDYDYAWANQTQDYPSAYCKTAAGTAGKTAACTLWTATANTYLHLVIVYANTSASALTLNVNSTSAATIYINGVVSSSTNYTLPAGSYIAFYDGTYWYINTDGTIPNVATTSSVSSKADKVVVVDASTPPASLDPNKVYQFGTLTGTVTIPAFSSVAAGDTEAKIWCFTFDTSSIAPTITWPAAITSWVGGSAPTINASKSYEVTVMDGIGAIMEA